MGKEREIIVTGTNGTSLFSLPLCRRLFQHAQESLFLLDEKGKIAAMNERAQGIVGRSAVGADIAGVFRGFEFTPDLLFGTKVIHTAEAHLAVAGTLQARPFSLTIVPVVEGRKHRSILVLARDLSETESFKDEIDRLRVKVHMLEAEKLRHEGRGGKDPSADYEQSLDNLERVNQRLKDINTRITKELELAALVQKSLVPSQVPDDRSIRLAFLYEPMGHVGGDYYDVIDLGDGKKGVIIADVSGHGVSSALIAAMLKISFTTNAPLFESPSALLAKLNREYCDLIKSGDFVTAFYAIFDPKRGRLLYSGAGHPYPLACSSAGSAAGLDRSRGFFLGMFEGAAYTDSERGLASGDRFLFYTDGLLEAYAEEKREFFGSRRLHESAERHGRAPLKEMVDLIYSDVKGFMGKSSFYDDITIVAVEASDAAQ